MLVRVAATVLLFFSYSALAASPPEKTAEVDQCAAAVIVAEAQLRLPAKLLGTIALVESGRPDPVTGRTRPWPWTINVGGAGYYFDSKEAAVAAVQALQNAGVRSVDVGCLQINLMYHPDAFPSLEQAFDPPANAAYGARFLGALYRQIGNWPKAAAAYHSETPDIAQDYERRVMSLWPLAAKYPDPGLADRRDPTDYSRYTPEYAALLRQARADHLHLAALHPPMDPGRATPPLAGALRQTRPAAGYPLRSASR